MFSLDVAALVPMVVTSLASIAEAETSACAAFGPAGMSMTVSLVTLACSVD